MADDQALAGLKVMIAVAKADGHLADAEKSQLEQALSEVAPMADLGKLIGEAIDLEAELAKIKDPEVRHATYRASLLLSVADGEAHADESKVLAKVRDAYGLADESKSVLNILSAAAKKRADEESNLDPEERARRVKRRIQKSSAVAAVLGLNPLPLLSIVSDMAIYGVQGELVAQIASAYGHKLTRKEAATTFLGSLGLGVARVALTQLVKFVPVWGSVVGGAAGYTTTYALGETMRRHFEAGGDLKSLGKESKKTFDTIKKGEAKEEFEKAKAEVEATAKARQAEIEAAAREVQAGTGSTDDLVAVAEKDVA